MKAMRFVFHQTQLFPHSHTQQASVCVHVCVQQCALWSILWSAAVRCETATSTKCDDANANDDANACVCMGHHCLQRWKKSTYCRAENVYVIILFMW